MKSVLQYIAESKLYAFLTRIVTSRSPILGLSVIFAITAIFFWPIITNISSYSEGGDAMFNAWTLSRDHHCILRESCPNYADGNIFFPNKDSMLYSETQLSAGLLTLPLYFINDNPIFANNVWTVVSFLLAGWGVYLLMRYLSKGNQVVSILGALIFELAPFKMSAIWHLQNQSIFYLPFILLLILLYFDHKRRRYLALALLLLILQFYASWYQMVFASIGLGSILLILLITKYTHWKNILLVGGVIGIAALSTLPLAKEYIRFSKTSSASFSIADQATYSASLSDYLIPQKDTLLGKAYYSVIKGGPINAYNPDSSSYHGMVLYLVAAFVIICAYKYRKRGKTMRQHSKLVLALGFMGAISFIMSLGPLLKIKGSYVYHIGALDAVIPMPYILVDKFLPQLAFVRALGRSEVLLLLALCCFLAFLPRYISLIKTHGLYKRFALVLVIILACVELLPFHQVPMNQHSYSYNLSVPEVYKHIKSQPEINNIIILAADFDYPGAGIPIAIPEQTMWAGYHNKNIYNGYSGYLPDTYYPVYWDFLEFKQDDIAKLKAMDLRYVIVDKQLSTSNSKLETTVSELLPSKTYEDERYSLFKVD